MSRGAVWWRRMFSAEGRISRRRYWAALLALTALGALGWTLAMLMGRVLSLIIVGPMALVWFLAGVCNNAKRLHDFGRSGRWQLAPAGVGVMVGLLAAGVRIEQSTTIFGLDEALLVMFGAFHLALGIVPGDAGANRFGTRASAAGG